MLSSTKRKLQLGLSRRIRFFDSDIYYTMSHPDVNNAEERRESQDDYIKRVVAARGPRRALGVDIPLHDAMRLVVEDARAWIYAWEIRNNLPTVP